MILFGSMKPVIDSSCRMIVVDNDSSFDLCVKNPHKSRSRPFGQSGFCALGSDKLKEWCDDEASGYSVWSNRPFGMCMQRERSVL